MFERSGATPLELPSGTKSAARSALTGASPPLPILRKLHTPLEVALTSSGPP